MFDLGDRHLESSNMNPELILAGPFSGLLFAGFWQMSKRSRNASQIPVSSSWALRLYNNLFLALDNMHIALRKGNLDTGSAKSLVNGEVDFADRVHARIDLLDVATQLEIQ